MAEITLIDDDPEYAQWVAETLRSAGHKVLVRNTDEEALRHILEEAPDLLILDVMFPGNPAGGLDLARQVRRRRETRHLPIILLTAVNQVFPMQFSSGDIDGDWMPVQEFLEKPVDKQRLLAAVDRLLETKP